MKFELVKRIHLKDNPIFDTVSRSFHFLKENSEYPNFMFITQYEIFKFNSETESKETIYKFEKPHDQPIIEMIPNDT